MIPVLTCPAVILLMFISLVFVGDGDGRDGLGVLSYPCVILRLPELVKFIIQENVPPYSACSKEDYFCKTIKNFAFVKSISYP